MKTLIGKYICYKNNEPNYIDPPTCYKVNNLLSLQEKYGSKSEIDVTTLINKHLLIVKCLVKSLPRMIIKPNNNNIIKFIDYKRQEIKICNDYFIDQMFEFILLDGQYTFGMLVTNACLKYFGFSDPNTN